MEYHFVRIVIQRLIYAAVSVLIPMLQSGINEGKPIIIAEVDYEDGFIEPICGIPENLREADYRLFAVITDDVLEDQKYMFQHLKKYIFIKRDIVENFNRETILTYLRHECLIKKATNLFEYLA